MLPTREQHYLDTLKPAYNLRDIADPDREYHVSAETRAKLSLARKGQPLTPAQIAANEQRRGIKVSVEVLAKRKATLATLKGQPPSPAQMAAKEKLRGVPRPAHVIERMVAAHRGVPLSEQHRALSSESHKGSERARWAQQNATAAAAEANRGQSRSAEIRAKISAAHKGRPRTGAELAAIERKRGIPMSAEQRAKISATKRANPRPGAWAGKTRSAEDRQKMRDARLRYLERQHASQDH